ncbi:hypothetical protein MHBO_001474 [Bonamia ostreae]|uniref:C2H2-type domain-containing protein n=1 Tax=Bonamia ostreae TaxID=126728 RepID=A0ABV2AJY5_9EUKA
MQKIIEKQISIFCQSCKIEVQREQNGFDHYRTDWHCYNVKLKCSAKPPLTLQQYQTFVLVDTNVKKTFKCNDCNFFRLNFESDFFWILLKQYFAKIKRKNFKSENAFKEHKLTRKHLKKLKSVCGNSGKKRNFVDSEFQCLFCQNGFDKQEKLDLHFNEHGFFIPCLNFLSKFKIKRV